MKRIKGKICSDKQYYQYEMRQKAKGQKYINSVENPTVPNRAKLKTVQQLSQSDIDEITGIFNGLRSFVWSFIVVFYIALFSFSAYYFLIK